jgi:hypothetical protein
MPRNKQNRKEWEAQYNRTEARKAYNREYMNEYNKKKRERGERVPFNLDLAKERRLAKKQKVYDYKASTGCILCQENDPCCLDLHHHNDDKIASVATMLHYRWERIEEEMKKCIILCANCHRKLHAGKVSIPSDPCS